MRTQKKIIEEFLEIYNSKNEGEKSFDIKLFNYLKNENIDISFNEIANMEFKKKYNYYHVMNQTKGQKFPTIEKWENFFDGWTIEEFEKYLSLAVFGFKIPFFPALRAWEIWIKKSNSSLDVIEQYKSYLYFLGLDGIAEEINLLVESKNYREIERISKDTNGF